MNIFSNKRYSNDIEFYICDMDCLFEWFSYKFILFYCSSGNKD